MTTGQGRHRSTLLTPLAWVAESGSPPDGQDGPAIRRLLRSIDPHAHARITRHELSGRNRIYLVDLIGRTAIVKLPGDRRFEALGRESSVLSVLSGNYPFMPEVLATSADPPAVAIQYLSHVEPLHGLASRDPGRAIEEFVKLARPLAVLHTLAVRLDAAPRTMSSLDPVWHAEWLNAGPASREFIRKAQKSVAISRSCQQGLAFKSPEGLIHGDIKADNVLISDHGPLLIDFEMSGLGRTIDDLSAVLGSLLSIWVDQLGLVDGDSAKDWISGAALEFTTIDAAWSRFIGDYQQAAGTAPIADQAVTDGVVLWLVSRAYAECTFRRRVPVRAWLFLQIAHNLARTR